MPTNDGETALLALRALASAGIRFALLQKLDSLLTEVPRSDIDLVVGSPPSMEASRISRAAEALGLRMASLWINDVGGTATAFFFDSTGLRGAQIDMMFDPEGLGRYSIRSDALLDSSLRTEPFPVVAPVDLMVYRFSKRRTKGQQAQLRLAEEELASLPESDTIAAVRRLIASRRLATRIVGRRLRGMNAKPVFRSAMLQLKRFFHRLRRPAGFWVHCPEHQPEFARSLARQFGAVMIRSSASSYPSGLLAEWLWFWRSVQPTRLRAGVAVSWGYQPPRSGPKPDLVLLPGQENEEAPALVLQAMANRFAG